MKVSSKSVIPMRHRPTLYGEECSWELDRELGENEGLAVLGILQNILADNKVKLCKVDLNKVEWIDPQTLLILGLIFAETSLNKKNIIINLGSTNEKYSTHSHRIFLKFLANQGFLTALGDHVIFRCEGQIEHELQELRLRLAGC